MKYFPELKYIFVLLVGFKCISACGILIESNNSHNSPNNDGSLLCLNKNYDNILLYNNIKYLKTEKKNNKSTVIDNNKPLRITLCAIGRDENLYIREWVEWYKNLGVNKIVLYDNNKVDGEKFEDVINDYIINGFVKVINRRGIVKTNKEIGPKEIKEKKSVQAESYHDCYYNNYKNNDWIFFFDIDEFLSIESKYNDIYEFLNDFNKYDGIRVQWRVYGDNGYLHYENKTVNERFGSRKNSQYSTRVKTIIKCKEYKKDLIINASGLLNRELTFVNLKKKRVKNYLNDKEAYFDLPVYLNHFITKSTEEYIKRKYKKPDASFGLNKEINFSINFIKGQYFKYNNRTKEKEEMFNSLINEKFN
ncbi:hypothetical protein H8356DRAFT_426419 [Neocallimastix lanati (nom. inval.)]|nr:hypothetical protein H8356DRAFT_426419 [Neocallimastix sp. JGI-2020a]